MATLKKYKSYFQKKYKIQTSELNGNINPGDNFYLYVNSHWLNNLKIPSHTSSYSVNEEIETIIEADIFFILEKSKNFVINGNKANSYNNKILDLIGKFVLSSSRPHVQKNSITLLKKKLQNLNCIRNINDVGEALAYFNKHKIPTIVSTYLQLEKTNVGTIYVLNFIPGTLGLPDDNYYKGTAPGKIKVLNAYINFIKKICKTLEIDDLSEIVTFESLFSINYSISSNNKYDLYYGYELMSKFKHFPWESYFNTYNIIDWKNKKFRIQSPYIFKFLEKALVETDIILWKQLLSLHLILHAISILPPPYDDYHYNFYEKILEGQNTKLPQTLLTLILVKKYLSQPLSEIYRKYFLKDSLKENTTEFIKKIRNSAIEQVNKNKWLQYSTKIIARTKIKEMILSIGWPEKNMPYIFPDLQSNNLLENIYLLGETVSIQEIQFLNKSIKPGMYWQEPTFNVNAFYYNEINQLVVPAASLMYPFFSKNKSIGWNYGGLGCVIGHEIVHAFDEDGKKYGPTGLYKNWWLKIDNRRYNKYSKKLIDFYNKTKIYNTFIDGKSTLNENLADLGGISIALHALKNEIKEKTDTEKKKELRDFFISYAVSWRTKEEKQKQLQSIITDKHSPPEIRVNNIVCHIDEWYDVFDISIDNKLYIHPEERISVF